MTRQTVGEMLAAARSVIDRVTPQAAARETAEGALLIDVRPADQRARDGHIATAVVLGLDVLEWRLDPDSPSRFDDIALDRRIILLCNQGYSSSLAGARLVQLGFTDVADVAGGFEAWVADGLPVT